MSSKSDEGAAGDSNRPKTKQEIKQQVQAALARADYQTAGKIVDYQKLSTDDLRSLRGRNAPAARTTRVESSRVTKVVQAQPIDLAQIKAEADAKYEKIKYRLVIDNAFITALCGSAAWGFFSYKVAASYGLGALLGTLYLVLLGRFVETLGSSEGGRAAGGGGPARLALVAVLVLICGKNKETLEVVPAVAGFLTYQLTTLLQAFYDDDAEDSSSSIDTSNITNS